MTGEGSFSGPFVITGLSGSGKTVLSRSLEDIGYLCVDNIPLDLVVELFDRSAQDLRRLVVVLDIRAQGMIDRFPEIYRQLESRSASLRLVFVEASPEILLRRFSVARRPHPLRDRSLERAITEEREQLAGVRTMADLIVDTTQLSPHDLRRQVLSLAGAEDVGKLTSIEVQSFSYLQGVPATASLVFDVRFLPNPYFEERLRALSGDAPEIAAWLEGYEEVGEAVERIVDLIQYLLPRYGRELKTHLTIAVGCTGGRHRSVYLAEKIGHELSALGHEVVVDHRDRDRWRFR